MAKHQPPQPRDAGIVARQGDTVDEWLVASWRVWPATAKRAELWEASEILARVPTGDADPKLIARAHEIARFLQEREDAARGWFWVTNDKGKRVRVSVPGSEEGR